MLPWNHLKNNTPAIGGSRSINFTELLCCPEK